MRWGPQGKEPHAEEQATIARIVGLRASGLSWHKIAVTLLRDRVRTKDGQAWSPDRVRRAYLSEMRRRASDPDRPPAP